jgi:8-oxo-dGTP pyrophosphatase MutT (NUDIX family)
MLIKIYFNDRPLFLCDELDPEINKYAHHDDAIFIDDFSAPAVNSMLHEMRRETVHAGIFLHANFEELKHAFWKKFHILQAGGGLVVNPKGDILFIFRRGKWDFPKGKQDPGETIEACAIREVKEETGLSQVIIKEPLLATYHAYDEDGKHILKESHWFLMQAPDQKKLVPQEIEGIRIANWINKKEVPVLLHESFPSIRDLWEKFSLSSGS